MIKRLNKIPIFLCISLNIIIIKSETYAQTDKQKAAANAFVESLVHRQVDQLVALQHPVMLQQAKPEQWLEMMDQLEAQGGKFIRHEYYSAEMNRGYASVVHHAYFQKDSIAFRVVVDSINLVGGFWIDLIKKKHSFPPPAYVKRSSFREDPVTIGDTLKPLPGLITIPEGPGPFAAVVLVHGSGPHDRDETILGNKPFRDIAWGLSTRGVIVLRYDKRTRAHPKSFDPMKGTVKEEVIDDALAAVRYLKNRKDVDTTRLSVIGHSLGAMLAPELAMKDRSVCGIAMLAAPARSLEETIAQQYIFHASLKDTMTAQDKELLNARLDQARKIQNEELPDTSMLLNAPAHYYYDLHKRNLPSLPAELDIPILIFQAGKDFQVPMKDFELWKRALEGKSNVRFQLCENCYHLFIETEDPAGPGNYEKEGHVSFSVITELAKWCKRKW